jgi:hypothetical protein
MEEGLIEASWLVMAKDLILQPDSVQYIDMKKAYCAGAYVVMKAVKIIGEKDFDEDVAASILDAIWQECEAFRISQQFDPEHN